MPRTFVLCWKACQSAFNHRILQVKRGLRQGLSYEEAGRAARVKDPRGSVCGVGLDGRSSYYLAGGWEPTPELLFLEVLYYWIKIKMWVTIWYWKRHKQAWVSLLGGGSEHGLGSLGSHGCHGWPKTKVSYFSSQKMGLLGISRELQFGVCNPGGSQVQVPAWQGKENSLIEGRGSWEG